MTAAILFDLGNTLATYYRREDFRPILERSLDRARERLMEAGLDAVPHDLALERALAENREAADFRFTPMIDRLARIFALTSHDAAVLGESLCHSFLEPIFATARPYGDAHSTLAELRRMGYKLGIVSNSPWGSPPSAWRRELERLGFTELVDTVVFCGDVGWRKPSKAIFDRAARDLGSANADCVFVGDDLEWDVAGSTAAGMRPILIDRDDRHTGFAGTRIGSLSALIADTAWTRGTTSP